MFVAAYDPQPKISQLKLQVNVATNCDDVKPQKTQVPIYACSKAFHLKVAIYSFYLLHQFNYMGNDRYN